MKTRKECIDLLKMHATELKQRFGIVSMRLFGSVATDSRHEGSDVDLLVDMSLESGGTGTADTIE